MKKTICIFVIITILFFLLSCAEKEIKTSEYPTQANPEQGMNSANIKQNQTNVSQGKPQQSQTSMQITVPASHQQNIYYHQALFATSPDAKTWTVNPVPIAEHASVPDIIQLQQDVGEFTKGTLISYFVDATASSEHEHIGVIASTDNGVTWTERETVTFENADDQIPVDPSIVQLDDGTLRMYYYDINTALKQQGNYIFYAADSSDGMTFTTKQVVYTSKTVITDPDVVYFNSKWFMYFVGHGRGGFVVMTSNDGLTFTEAGIIPMSGVPGVIVVDNAIDLYGCGMNSIPRKTSSDGITFGAEEIAIAENACDPSPIQLQDGTYAMVFKGYS